MQSCYFTLKEQPFYCSELWYLQAPATGTHDIVISWAGQVRRRLGGGISLYNVAQQAPDATASNTGTLVPNITTTATTSTTAPMFVDGMLNAAGGTRDPTEPQQTERYDLFQAGVSAAGSTRPVVEAGSWDMSWSFGDADVIHVVAAFAEAQ